MAQVKGATKAERDAVRAQNRREHQVQHAIGRVGTARTGHDKVKATTLAALAASKRIADAASTAMAVELARVVERFDVETNWEVSDDHAQ